MKNLVTLLVFIFISNLSYAHSVEDSLIANIGKKAKVVFYAENKADFNEIAKYDLNKLFAEVRKRSEKNFSNNEEVTLREVGENLKNREINTTVSTKKWLKNMNLNLFVGGSPFTGSMSVVGPAYFSDKHIPVTTVRDVFTVENKNTFMIGVGGFYDKMLAKKKHSIILLRYGFGFDLMNTRLNINRTGTLVLGDEKVDENYNIENYISKNKIVSTNLYAQFMPTLNLTNWKGQKTFSVGIGFKVATNFNNITFKDYFQRGSFLSLKNGPNIFIQQPTLQTAFVANIGYKFINAFIQVIPNHTIIFTPTYYPGFPFDDSRKQVSKNTYTIGLRFGK